MHQFGWFSESGGGRRGNFLNLLQKEGGVPREGGGVPQKRGVPTLEETTIFGTNLRNQVIPMESCIGDFFFNFPALLTDFWKGDWALGYICS